MTFNINRKIWYPSTHPCLQIYLTSVVCTSAPILLLKIKLDSKVFFESILGHSNLITCLTSFFLEKKSCQTQKKKNRKVTFGVLRPKVVLKFSVRLKKKKKSASFKNIVCKGDSINYRKLLLL